MCSQSSKELAAGSLLRKFVLEHMLRFTHRLATDGYHMQWQSCWNTWQLAGSCGLCLVTCMVTWTPAQLFWAIECVLNIASVPWPCISLPMHKQSRHPLFKGSLEAHPIIAGMPALHHVKRPSLSFPKASDLKSHMITILCPADTQVMLESWLQ